MIDHLVYATPDLERTVRDFEKSTGVAPTPGGSHPGHGTRNYLVSLSGSTYLEIIGPDLGQPEPDESRPFGIDALAEPKLVAWCVRPGQPLSVVVERVRAAGYDPGEIVTMSRTRPDGVELVWELTMPRITPEVGGVLPFFIDWGHTTHPSFALPAELELAKLELRHPEPAWVKRVLQAVGPLDLVHVVEADEPGIRGPIRPRQR